MLAGLSIRDIVLVDRLRLSFTSGLSVLTGETGAGKSILLDSLGLATGSRADRALVRRGAERGIVTAAFDLPSDHAVFAMLADEGISIEDDQLILKRQITAEGKSRAWINDESVGQGLLARTGAMILEVHGQHDDRGLLDAGAHRNLLDRFGDYEDIRERAATLYQDVKGLRQELAEARQALVTAQEDEDYLRHAVSELETLGLAAGEEEELATRRTVMMQGEKLVEDLDTYHRELMRDGGVDAAVRGILRRMDRVDASLVEALQPTYSALDRAAIELAEGIEALERLQQAMDFDAQELEQIEERLFEIRRLARKHACAPDALVDLLETLSQKLKTVEAGDERVQALQEKLAAAETQWQAAVLVLREKRIAAAADLDALVMAELPPLKLEKAIFRTAVRPLEEADWASTGGDHVTFEVQTNPGSPFGEMVKIASGGELARFILALKVVLTRTSSLPVMVFDEVDRGIGGATADAVGERLKRLSQVSQVLVVTHSPQVAARGNSHFQIEKQDDGQMTLTHVTELKEDARREELARMLSGAEVTEEARAAANRLLDAE